MLKILINAYACSPCMGSEPGMAWNWVSNLAKFCELYIITEGEFRDRIEEVVPTLEQGKTYLMAKDICKVEKMDVLHQLNMIGFREPGYLWRSWRSIRES